MKPKSPKKISLGLIIVGGLAAGFAVLWFYRAQREWIRGEQQRQLVTIADSKTAAIASWRRERIADVEAISQNLVLGSYVGNWLRKPPDPSVDARLGARLDQLKVAYEYKGIQLFDTSGRARLSRDPLPPACGSSHALEVIAQDRAGFLEFHSHDGGKSIQIAVMAPLRDDKGSVVAAVILWIDPSRFLYPHLKFWPVPSLTGESLLATRSGDDIVYLSELRHRDNTGLKLSRHITESGQASFDAALSQEIITGLDYRGVPVLAAARAIPDTPWYVVAKIDEAEAFSELNVRTYTFAAITGLTLILVVCAVWLLWTTREAGHYRELYRVQTERLTLAARYEALHRHANDIILLLDENARILEANERAVEAYGYPQSKLLNLNGLDLQHPSLRAGFDQQWEAEASREGTVFETLHCRADGSPMTVEVSSRPIQTDGRNYRLQIVRDITERKRAEQALVESQADLNRAQSIAHIGSWRYQGQVLSWSDETYRMLKVPKGTRPTYQTFLETVHPDDVDSVDRCWKAALKGGPYDIEHRIIVEGEVRWVREHAILEFDQHGGLLDGFGTVQDITERKQAEDALRQVLLERERYLTQLEAVLDNMSEGLVVADLDGNLFHWNRAALVLHGFSNVEKRRGFEDLDDVFEISIDGEGVIPVDRWPLARILRGETVSQGEAHIRRKDSDWSRIFSYSGALARNKQGEPLLAVLTLNDVTEARKAEEALRAAHEELAAIHANAPVGLLVVDEDMRVHKLNDRAAQFAGRNFDLVGCQDGVAMGRLNTLDETQERRDHPLCANGIVRLSVLETIRNGVPQPGLEAWVPVLVDGQRHMRCLLVSTAVLQSGDTKRALICAHDITDRKLAEETLRESEERFRVAFEDAAIGMVLVESDGRLGSVNGVLCEMLGYSREELLGKRFEDLTYPDDQGIATDALRAMLAGEQPRTAFEKRYVRKDGSVVWTQVLSAVLNDEAGLPARYITQIQDMTARKRAEEEIRRLNAELEQRVLDRTAQLEASNKELQAFSYSVAHDLRTPLRGIDGWSLVLAEDYSDQLDDRARQYLDKVRTEAQRMGLLIDDLLSLARLSRFDMQYDVVNLSALAERIAERLADDEPERAMRFLIQPELLVSGDARLLEVALMNLLSNAAKFTRPRAEARIEFGSTEHDGVRVFFIRDNGVGFNMAHVDILFGAFQRLHKATEFPGSGIGLATVKRIILRHSGRIWAEAETDRGATFYFTLGSHKRPSIGGSFAASTPSHTATVA